MKNYTLISKIFILLFNFLLAGLVFADNGSNETIRQMLSSRHPAININNLLDTAGSEDNLIEELSRLRTESSPPFLGINAMRVLMRFSERDDVKNMLIEDVNSPDRFGLTSYILSRIDDIENSELKLKIAQTALRKSKNFDSERQSRINALLNSSSDKKIKKLVNN